jgi:predicted anti-sigma-YlaC factor YlaD
MNEHESIRELLSLASAGALDAAGQRRVEEHARGCETCRAELERWGAYSDALRHMRPPPLPPQLMERTRARILESRAAAASRRQEALTLAALATFGWIVAATVWLLFRIFTGGALTLASIHLKQIVTWSVISTAFVWVTGAAAALMLGRWRSGLRRDYEPLS